MFYAFFGFVFGCYIPYVARRFAKFMPATFAYAIVEIIRPYIKTVSSYRSQDPRYRKLKNKFLWRSFIYGIITAVLSFVAFYHFGKSNILWHLFFFWALLLLTEIDIRMFLLPDILTVPLLIFGFVYSAFIGDWTYAADSAAGALLGYFMPVMASLALVWKNKDMFGGGDIKLLAAIGAWFGLEKIIYTILLSVILFALQSLALRQRSGAYGPAVAISAIIIALYFF